jgi:hypothetical protein
MDDIVQAFAFLDHDGRVGIKCAVDEDINRYQYRIDRIVASGPFDDVYSPGCPPGISLLLHQIKSLGGIVVVSYRHKL